MALEDRLSRFSVVEPTSAPHDLVTMNTMFRVVVAAEDAKSQQGEVRVMTLVYPHAANISDGRVSILTPIGMEILGTRVGDLVAWRGRDGAERRMKVEEVLYQPEASGDWHL